MKLPALLRKLLPAGGPARPRAGQRPHLHVDDAPDVLYAIGDVHGCHHLLERLEDRIRADAEGEAGEKILVRLGDYVDRGPDSAAVLDRLLARDRLPFRCLNLAGNHEDMMLDFLANPHSRHRWLQFGGVETLNSYGIYQIPEKSRDLAMLLEAHVPQDHRTLLEGLPSLIVFPGICLVHAGIDPARPLAGQTDDILLWKRPLPVEEVHPFLVVHGHTPVPSVETRGSCVNVDTGAYSSGVLSAVKIRKTGKISVLACN